MSDDIDTDAASASSEALRESLVALVLAAALMTRAPARHATDGQRICIDCGEPIAHQRLAAIPHAVACTPCEAAAELRGKRYRKNVPCNR